MTTKKNKSEQNEFVDHSQASGYQSDRLPIDESPMRKSAKASSVFNEFRLSEIEKKIEEEEHGYRMNLMQTETQFTERLYENHKEFLENLSMCADLQERKNWLQSQFNIINEYAESLKCDYDAIVERRLSNKMKFLTIRNQDNEIARLSNEIREKEERNSKAEAEKAKRVAILEKIREEKKAYQAQIASYQKSIEEDREKKKKFDDLQAKLREAEEEKSQVEKRHEELKDKVKAVKEARIAEIERRRADIQQKKLRNEKLKLEVEKRKEKVKQVQEIQKLIETLEQREKFEMDERQKQRAHQMAELRKVDENLHRVEEKLETIDKEYGEFCGANNIEHVSFKELDVAKIQENLKKSEQLVHDKKIELEESERNLENLQRNRAEEIRMKEDKLESTKNLLQAEKLKVEEKKKIVAELNQKAAEIRKRIDEKTEEKQKISLRKENSLFYKNKLEVELQTLKTRNADEEKKLGMAENLYKDAIEVNQHVNNALKSKENHLAEVEKFKKEHEAKLSAIENRILEKSKEQKKRILELETEIERNAKLLSKKRRESKKRDAEEMKHEQKLREKLSKLEKELAELERNSEESKKIENVPSTIVVKTQQTPKSILKSPLPTRAARNFEPKSPKTVKFEILSEDSLTQEMPCTQKPQESP